MIKKRIWELDALRGLCILGMLVFHLIYDITQLYGLINWQMPGWLTVVAEVGGGVFILLSMALGGIAAGTGQQNILMLLLSVTFMWLLCGVSFRGSVGNREYIPVNLRWEDKEMNIIALKDTGNTLRDPLTGEQVLVAGADVAKTLLGLTGHQLRHPVETMAIGILPGLRLIPYRAVGQPGAMLLAVRFPSARIGKRQAQPLVAFAPEEIAKGEMYQMLAGGSA